MTFNYFYLANETPGRVELLSGGGRTAAKSQGKGSMAKIIDHMFAHALLHYPGSSVRIMVGRTPNWDTLVEEGLWTMLQKWVRYIPNDQLDLIIYNSIKLAKSKSC